MLTMAALEHLQKQRLGREDIEEKEEEETSTTTIQDL